MGEKMMELAERMGWNEADLKKFTEEMFEAIHEAVSTLEVKNKRNSVDEIFKEIGIKSNILGYEYLKIAILEAVKDFSLVDGGLTTILNPRIAKMYNTTPKKVERATRYAVESAWEKPRSQEAMRKYLGSAVEKPSTILFISAIARVIRENNL